MPNPPTTYSYAPVAGQFGLFLWDGIIGPVIASTDYVLLHEVIYNQPAVANVWGHNAVSVKNVAIASSTTLDAGGNKTSNVYGSEISISNNTSEPSVNLPGTSGNGYPQKNGQVIGLFLSYIHTVNVASAAISIGGLGNSAAPGQNGWLTGLWIDGITSTGTGIVFRDAVSGTGMRLGIDLSNVTGGFQYAALLLGTGHSIAGKTSGGALQNLIQLSTSNEVLVGAAGLPVKIQGSKLTLATPSSSTAVAGSVTPPTRVAGYLQVVLNTTTVKVPYYA